MGFFRRDFVRVFFFVGVLSVEVLSVGVLSVGVLSAEGFDSGVLSVGVLSVEFLSVVVLSVGFCPQRVSSAGVCPQGFLFGSLITHVRVCKHMLKHISTRGVSDVYKCGFADADADIILRMRMLLRI